MKLWKKALSLALCLCLCLVLSLMPALAPVEAEAASVPTYISGIYFAANKNQSDAKKAVKNAGYTLIDYDLNKGCGAASKYIYMGYKTTSDPSQAITGIFFSDDIKNPAASYTFPYNGYQITANKVSDVDLNDGALGDYIYPYTTTDRNFGNPITAIQIKGNNSINGAESNGTWTIGRQISSGRIYGTDGRNLNAATVGDKIYLHYKQFKGEVTANYWYLDADGNRQKYVMTKSVGDHLQQVELDKTDFPDAISYNNWTYVRSLYGSVGPFWRDDTQSVFESSGTTSVSMMDSGKNMYAVYCSQVQFGFGEYDAVYGYTDFKINFDANGGYGTMYPDYASQVINTGSSSIVKSGALYTITDRNVPVYDSKCPFLGWSTDKNAKTPDYKIGDTVVTTTAETTLYAVWRDHGGMDDNICDYCGKSFDSAAQSDGVYQITNKAELIWFQQYVNQGNQSANAILVNDIDMGGHEWTPIGSTGLYYKGEGTDKGYKGTFNGNGKCISNFSITTSATEEKTYGLFGTLSGTVKHLGIDNVTYSFPNNAKDLRAGGIVGQMLAGSVVEDCYVINSSIAPGQYIVGGIAACSYGGSIQRCFTYNVTVSGHARCGNLVSDTINDNKDEQSKGVVRYCYTDADRICGTQSSGSHGPNGEGISAERFASGEIAYKLGVSALSFAWKQDIGTDALPGFHGSWVFQVYRCDGKTVTWSNSSETPQKTHTYENYICTLCGAYAEDVVAKVTKKGVMVGLYTTLDDAFKAVENTSAEDEAVVWLLKDLKFTTTQKYSYGVYTLDLNGHELCNEENWVLSYGKSGGTLTINDSVGTGKITGKRGIYALWTTLTINGGTIDVEGIAVDSQEATVVINGGSFSGRKAVVTNLCNVTLNSGTFYATYRTLEFNNTVFVINGGTFTGEETCLLAIKDYNRTGNGNIYGGTFTGKESAVYTEDHDLYVYGGTFISDGYDLGTYHSGSPKLVLYLGENGVGATFPGGLTVQNLTLKNIIQEGAGYWQGTKMAMLTDGMTAYQGGDVVIKPTCIHNYVDLLCACGAFSSEAGAGVSINGVSSYYATVAEAAEKVLTCTAEDEAVVFLLKDGVLPETLNVASCVFTLDLGGKTLQTASGDSVLTVSQQAELTVSNGTITGSKNGICVLDGGTLKTNASINGSTTGVHAENSTLTVTGGTINGGTTGIYAKNSTLYFTGGTISGATDGIEAANCTLTFDNGTVQDSFIGMTITDCTMTMNFATINGGQFGLDAESSHVTVIGGNILGSNAVLADKNSVITFYGGYINGNYTDIIVTNDSKVTFELRQNRELKFYKNLTVQGVTLNQLLGEGAAYWVGKLQVTLRDDATSVNATQSNSQIVVKPQCSHSDCTLNYTNNEVNHIATKSCCSAYVYEPHSYDGCLCLCGAHAPVESGKCEVCDATLVQVRMYVAEGNGSDSSIWVNEGDDPKVNVYVPEGNSITWVGIMDPEQEYSFFWKSRNDAAQCSFEIQLGTEVIAVATEEDCGNYMDGHRIYPVCSHAEATYEVTADGHWIECPECGVEGEQAHSFEGCQCVCDVQQHTLAESGLCADCGKLIVTVNMADSYGDGWNDSEIRVYRDNSLVYKIEMEDGENAVWRGALDLCGEYEFEWRDRGYSDECSFELFIGNEMVLSADVEACGAFENKQVFYTYAYHHWTDATCTEPKTCDLCGVTDGEALGHNFVNGACSFCGAAEPISPISLKYPSISFKDEILINIYFALDGLDDVVEMGLITYDSQVESWNINNAQKVVSGYKYYPQENLYIVTTNGIPAKNMGDRLWFAVYTKLSDGSYIYSKLVNYSPKDYADTMLGQYNEALDRLLVSMLNYGAAAQLYFGYNTENLVNRDLTDAQKAMVSDYNSNMIGGIPTVPAEKQGAFASNKGFSNMSPSVSFKGALAINYYCTPVAEPVGDVTLYYWDEAAYAANAELTAQNATGYVKMTRKANGQYTASVTGIPARKMNSVVYVAFCYSDGNTDYSSGILPYSIGEYCRYYAGINHEFTDMAKATAVYGFYAKEYFG